MKRVVRFLAVLTIAVAACPPAVAQQPRQPPESQAVLEEVVVTATRSAEEIRKVPAAVTVITANI